MSSAEDDVKLVASFLTDALGGKFVVSFASLNTLKAFKRLGNERRDHIILGLCGWIKEDEDALEKLSDAIVKSYEKCPKEIRSEVADVFTKLAERIMSHE